MAQKPSQRARPSRRLKFGQRLPIPARASADVAQVLRASSASGARGQYQARVHLLTRLAAVDRGLLQELAAIPDAFGAPDERAISRWRQQRRLPDWVDGFAYATVQLWARWPSGRGRVWATWSTGQGGSLVPDRGRRPAAARELSIPAWHFDWYARRLAGESFEDIEGSPGRKLRGGQGADVSGIRRAVRSLRAILEKNLE